ncbi:MAG: ribosome silencing factor [Bacteroidota bacterium]|jgi:ribosome-associated protein
MAKKADQADFLAQIAVRGLQEKKGMDIVVMDLRKVKGAFADFFVIGHGSSDRQVEALADSVEEEIRKALGEKPNHREGGEKSEWVLLDYINVVIHVFSEQKRRFYGLEELWGDAEITRFE